MSWRDSELPLHQMLDHAREAMILSKGKSLEELASDRVLCLAIVRLLEIVGEAATRVPKEERSRRPEVPWTQIISLRNRLIHLAELVLSLDRSLGPDTQQAER
jgi:uncharacterized protein with HEPN domain